MHLPDFKVARSSEKIDYKKIDYKIDSKYLNKYKGKKCFLKTYGCQMNEHDSENIKGILELLGFDFTDNIEDADLVLLNTFLFIIKNIAYLTFSFYIFIISKLT